MNESSPWHSSFIKYCIIFSIIGAFLVILECYLRGREIDKLREENALISSNLSYTLEQLHKTEKALEEREIAYRRIEDKAEKLDRELQEIEENANEEEKNWLEGIIPSSIDNTIPY